MVYCANLGDSKSIHYKLLSSPEINFLSLDHKPDNILEKKRIEKSGL